MVGKFDQRSVGEEISAPTTPGLVWDFLLQVLQELILDSNDLVQFMQWSLGLDGQRTAVGLLEDETRFHPPNKKDMTITQSIGFAGVSRVDAFTTLVKLCHNHGKGFVLNPQLFAVHRGLYYPMIQGFTGNHHTDPYKL